MYVYLYTSCARIYIFIHYFNLPVLSTQNTHRLRSINQLRSRSFFSITNQPLLLLYVAPYLCIYFVYICATCAKPHSCHSRSTSAHIHTHTIDSATEKTQSIMHTPSQQLIATEETHATAGVATTEASCILSDNNNSNNSSSKQELYVAILYRTTPSLLSRQEHKPPTPPTYSTHMPMYSLYNIT